jgi:hypothetical protein
MDIGHYLFIRAHAEQGDGNTMSPENKVEGGLRQGAIAPDGDTLISQDGLSFRVPLDWISDNLLKVQGVGRSC